MTELSNKEIPVTAGAGTGNTPLASFDAALYAAGIGNLNLVHLSSVIPVGYNPTVKEFDRNHSRQGDRLYCVYAANTTDVVGNSVAAGLGWVQTITDSAPWGLFVEHIGPTEESVQEQIEASLASMTEYRTGVSWGNFQSHITSISCAEIPVTALVAAHYKLVAW